MKSFLVGLVFWDWLARLFGNVDTENDEQPDQWDDHYLDCPDTQPTSPGLLDTVIPDDEPAVRNPLAWR